MDLVTDQVNIICARGGFQLMFLGPLRHRYDEVEIHHIQSAMQDTLHFCGHFFSVTITTLCDYCTLSYALLHGA